MKKSKNNTANIKLTLVNTHYEEGDQGMLYVAQYLPKKAANDGRELFCSEVSLEPPVINIWVDFTEYAIHRMSRWLLVVRLRCPGYIPWESFGILGSGKLVNYGTQVPLIAMMIPDPAVTVI